MANLKLNYADGFSETKSMNTVGSFNIVLTADDISWDLSKAHSLAAKIGNASGYLTDLRINLDDIEDKSQGTISIKLDDQFMADFPPDLYFLEVWADTDDGRLIFPSDGGSALTFTINRNIMSNFEGVAKVTLVQFQEDFNELKKIIQKNQAFLDVSLKDSLNYSNDLSKKYEDLNQHGRDQLETDLSNARQNIEDKKSDAHSYVDKVNSDSTNDIQSKVDNAKSYIDNNTDKNTKAVDNTVSKAKSDLANYSSDRQNDVNNTVNSAKSDLTSFSQARQNEINDRVNQLKQTINTQKAQYENDVGNIKNDFEYQKGTYADLRDETRNLLQQLEANEGKVHASVEDIQDARFGAQTKADNAQNQAVQQSANYTNQKYDELNNKNNILSSRIDDIDKHNFAKLNPCDLNDVRQSGTYYTYPNNLTQFQSIPQIPNMWASFTLSVFNSGYDIVQKINVDTANPLFRHYSNNTWQSWQEIASKTDLQNKTNDLSSRIDENSRKDNARMDYLGATKYDKSETYNRNEVYNKSEIDNVFSNKIDNLGIYNQDGKLMHDGKPLLTAQAPNAPKLSLSVDKNTNNIQYQIYPPDISGGAEITGYVLYYKKQQGSNWQNKQLDKNDLIGQFNGEKSTTYNVQAIARNYAGDSTKSGIQTILSADVPELINFDVEGIYKNKIEYSFSFNDNGANIQSYIVYYKKASDYQWNNFITNQTNGSFDGESNVSYQVKVKCFNIVGYSNESSIKSAVGMSSINFYSSPNANGTVFMDGTNGVINPSLVFDRNSPVFKTNFSINEFIQKKADLHIITNPAYYYWANGNMYNDMSAPVKPEYYIPNSDLQINRTYHAVDYCHSKGNGSYGVNYYIKIYDDHTIQLLSFNMLSGYTATDPQLYFPIIKSISLG